MRIIRYGYVLLSIYLVIVSCDEQAEKQGHPALSEDYLSIFKNMPVLYEYILATLTKNPEVLEYSRSYYSDANIYDYKRNNDASNTNNNDSEQSNKKRDTNFDIDNALENSSGYEQNVVSNISDFVQDNHDKIINKRDDDKDEDKNSVNPKEVEEKALWAEEQLEEYNNSR